RQSVPNRKTDCERGERQQEQPQAKSRDWPGSAFGGCAFHRLFIFGQPAQFFNFSISEGGGGGGGSEPASIESYRDAQRSGLIGQRQMQVLAFVIANRPV